MTYLKVKQHKLYGKSGDSRTLSKGKIFPVLRALVCVIVLNNNIEIISDG